LAAACLICTAISTASSPNSVENLIIGFSAAEVVSLNGSPTVSPTNVVAGTGEFVSFRSPAAAFASLISWL
jgi:hypothetical protein